MIRDGEMVSERLATLQRLRRGALGEAEATALRAHLLNAGPADGSENALRDVLLIRLEQGRPGEELMDLLDAIHADRRQHHLMRDYAIQHVSAAYARSGADGRQHAAKLLRDALTETDQQIAGTALLTMKRIVRKTTPSLREAEALALPDTIRREEVEAAALRLAQAAAASPLTRLSAIQVCAGLAVAAALPVAVELARTSASVPLRIAAIAAVGDLGGLEEQGLLQEFARGAELTCSPETGQFAE